MGERLAVKNTNWEGLVYGIMGQKTPRNGKKVAHEEERNTNGRAQRKVEGTQKMPSTRDVCGRRGRGPVRSWRQKPTERRRKATRTRTKDNPMRKKSHRPVTWGTGGFVCQGKGDNKSRRQRNWNPFGAGARETGCGWQSEEKM